MHDLAMDSRTVRGPFPSPKDMGQLKSSEVETRFSSVVELPVRHPRSCE